MAIIDSNRGTDHFHPQFVRHAQQFWGLGIAAGDRENSLKTTTFNKHMPSTYPFFTTCAQISRPLVPRSQRCHIYHLLPNWAAFAEPRAVALSKLEMPPLQPAPATFRPTQQPVFLAQNMTSVECSVEKKCGEAGDWAGSGGFASV
jgi:hypothetical protein